MSDKKLLGRLGEQLVANVLGGTLSENEFDDVKDLTLSNGSTVEVKTQVRWRRENAFTIDETATERNINKCLEVDHLIFVEPGRNGIIRLYECVDRTYTIKTPRGKRSYLFSIDKMHLIKEIVDVQLCEKMIDAAKTNRAWLV